MSTSNNTSQISVRLETYTLNHTWGGDMAPLGTLLRTSTSQRGTPWVSGKMSRLSTRVLGPRSHSALQSVQPQTGQTTSLTSFFIFEKAALDSFYLRGCLLVLLKNFRD